MERLPNCASYVHGSIWKSVCDIYPKGIPKNIYLEYITCDKYELKIDTDIDDSLPLAKGR